MRGRVLEDYSAQDPEPLLSRLANVRQTGPGRWRATCPAHGTGRNQALSIALKGDKLLFHCFAGCSPDAVLAAVGLTWRDLFRGASRVYYSPPPSPPPPTPAAPTPEDLARWVQWWEAATPSHPLIARYLRARGLSIDPPPTLRLALWGEPVMLARVTGPKGELRGLHMTVLKPDGTGRLAKRLAGGSHPMGGAIQLYPPEPAAPLALTEGIETALAVRQATGWPVWACVSAGGMERVVVPPGVHEVVIAADHDRAGVEAAEKLARRLLGEGRRVRLAVPPTPGQDWLDVVAEEGGDRDR